MCFGLCVTCGQLGFFLSTLRGQRAPLRSLAGDAPISPAVGSAGAAAASERVAAARATAAALPSAVALPPPSRAVGMSLGSVRVPAPPSTLVVAFANSAMSAYALNWLMHVKQVPTLRPYFLVSLDDAMQREAERRGEPVVPALLLHGDARLSLEGRGGGGYLRNDADGFKLLGKAKALFTEELLKRGYAVLLSDVDSVWLADPFPFLGGERTPGLARADVLVTNDYADARRDNDISTVFNTGALLLRPSARAVAFVREWALRTEITGLIGNDQTEFNRLLSSQYVDGDTSCRVPDCLRARKLSVPASAAFDAPAGSAAPCPPHGGERRDGVGGGGDGGDVGGAPTAPCEWEAVPSLVDKHTNLTAVDVHPALASLGAFHAANHALGRRAARGERARVAHWMWGGRVRVGLLPMAQFMQGHTFFVQHLHEQTRVPPVHVHVTYTLSADYGKRLRLRSAGLWQAEDAAYYSDGNFVHVVGLREALLALLRLQTFPEGVWRCAPGEASSRFFDGVPHRALTFAARAADRRGGGGNLTGRLCYHPAHFVPSPPPAGNAGSEADYEVAPDPAMPHVRLQHMTRLVLRNAFALAAATRRRLVLPTIWCMCDRYWWHLKDCRMPGAEALPMPFACPLDMSFNIDDWQALPAERVQFVEAAFLDNPRTHARIRAPNAARTLRIARDGAAGGRDDELPDETEPLLADGSAAEAAPAGGAHAQPLPLTLASGSTIDDVVEALGAHAEVRAARVMRVSASSLLRLSSCGFREEGARGAFERDVLRAAFAGQHSYCSGERNPNLALVLERARRTGMADERALTLFRNCTGNPANAFNKPKVDLGPGALRFSRACVAAAAAGGPTSAAARALDAVLR